MEEEECLDDLEDILEEGSFSVSDPEVGLLLLPFFLLLRLFPEWEEGVAWVLCLGVE